MRKFYNFNLSGKGRYKQLFDILSISLGLFLIHLLTITIVPHIPGVFILFDFGLLL